MNFTNSSSATAPANCRVMEEEHFLENAFPTLLSITLNLSTCPFIIFMNALVIIAIKTRRRLQTIYNILLACSAVTDLVVGMVSQPIFVAQEIYLLAGASLLDYCSLYSKTIYVFLVPCIASLLLLALLSIERYLAMKYSLRYVTIVTTPRLTASVVCSWVVSAFPLILRLIPATIAFAKVVYFVSVILSILVIIFCHTSVYFVSRRHMIQIKAEQVASEAKAKFLADRKALKTTSIIITFLFLSYVPGILYGGIKYLVPSSYSGRMTHWLPLATSCILLNSFFNPFIYCWRNKDLRKALLALLSHLKAIGR